jgi:phospholipid transport system substrate-binding protein
MYKKITSLFLAILLFSLSAVALAIDPPPLAMLKNVSNQMITELNINQGKLKNNDQLIYSIVRRVLLPHIDLTTMSRSVVGKDSWQVAPENVQKQFINEFTMYVIRTYSAALESYSGQTMKFFPMRSYDPSQNRAQISSEIQQKDGPAIPVSYRLAGKSNNWLVYDFSVEGVSIVQNYRSQFASTLQKSGLAGLVQEIHKHNQGGN